MAFDLQACVAILLAALPYLPLTLLLALAPVVLALPFAFALALPQHARSRFAWVPRLIITLLRALPLVLTLLLTYFLLQAGIDVLGERLGLALRGSMVPLPVIAILAFALGILPTLAEAVRAALLSVAPGQVEAARALGMTRVQELRRIVIPQAIPVLMPQLGNTVIGCFKASALAYLISVTDVLNAATMEAARNYQYSEAYVAAALVYWIVCAIAGRLTQAAETLARRLCWGERGSKPEKPAFWKSVEALS